MILCEQILKQGSAKCTIHLTRRNGQFTDRIYPSLGCIQLGKGIIYFVFQAKLRLEMAAEHNKLMVHKDLEAKDEEMEQLRYNMQKKVR